jgi:iron-sulfur cluster assembly protein
MPAEGEDVKMIEMTEKAIQEVKRLQETDSEAKAGFLRVQVVGGGCSGMSYKLGFDKDQTAADKVFEHGGVKLLVDTKSYLFLQGTQLDFSDGLNGKGFTFSNPNANRTCGCGSSFSA